MVTYLLMHTSQGFALMWLLSLIYEKYDYQYFKDKTPTPSR